LLVQAVVDQQLAEQPDHVVVDGAAARLRLAFGRLRGVLQLLALRGQLASAPSAEIQYERNEQDFHRGTFRARGDVIDVFPAYEEDKAIRIELFGDEVDALYVFDPLRGTKQERLERVAVYLDVSGSMEAVLPALYAALAGCLDKVEPVVRGFSTRIGAISHAQLREGVRLGTGGTEIATVTADLIARRVRRAIIVTDGWVGVIPADHAAALRRRRVRLAVVLTSPGDGAFALRLRLPVFTLPELT
jgi:hypothetical protein